MISTFQIDLNHDFLVFISHLMANFSDKVSRDNGKLSKRSHRGDFNMLELKNPESEYFIPKWDLHSKCTTNTMP